MSVFISHVEEDRATAESIVRGLQAAGFEAWSYELSSVPGPTYLSQVMDAIEKADAIILVISPEALGSHQVAREIEAAHELDRPIVPVLQNITHEKYLQRRPEWRLALGAYTSIAVPPEGVGAIMPKIVGGLEALGVARGAGPGGPDLSTLPPPSPPTAALRRPWVLVVAVLVVLGLAAGAAAWVLSSGGDEPATEPATTQGTGPTGPGSDTQAPPPLSELEATIEVEPTKPVEFESVSISYSITNTSDRPLKKSTTEMVILVGASAGGTGVLLADISQDIDPGTTVEDTVRGDLTGASTGPQKVYIMVGERVSGGSTGNRFPAETSITIGR